MTNEKIANMDSFILLSVINTKLRDEYSSLDLLCSDLELDKKIIIERLKKIDYRYNVEYNQFK